MLLANTINIMAYCEVETITQACSCVLGNEILVYLAVSVCCNSAINEYSLLTELASIK